MKDGGPISPDSANNMLKQVLEGAGIPKVRFHDLRYTFPTITLQNGMDIKTVSGMLGHFSAGFTPGHPCPCRHLGTERSSSDHGKYPESVNSAL